MEPTTPSVLDTARDLLRGNRPREAAALLGGFLREHPQDEQAWHILSLALSDPEKQAYALRRVLKLNPGNRAARAQLSRLLAPRPAPTPQAGTVDALARPALEAVPSALPGRGREESATPPPAAPRAPSPPIARSPSTFSRVARYFAVKAAVLFLTVAVGLFLATVLINYGGFIDQIFEANIEDALRGMAMGLRDVPIEEVPGILEEARLSMREAYGLNDPFLLRCFRFFLKGLTLNWGEAERLIVTGLRSTSVSDIILERLPRSLLLLGAGNMLVFVTSLFLAMFLSKRYGSFIDRAVVGLSPLSAAPTWVHGILLTVIFAAHLGILPFGGMYDEVPPAQPIGYVWVVAKHMILPVAAIFMATFFQSAYAWRTFFVLHSREDYVEMAEAKGLPARMLERRYILQPALPFVITSFVLVLITSWQGLLVLEVFFNWPGIGQLFVEAVHRLDRPVLVALVVTFAYLLAITVLALDFVYALVDPRVRIGGGNGAARRRPRTARDLGAALFSSRRSRILRRAGREQGAFVTPSRPLPKAPWFPSAVPAGSRRQAWRGIPQHFLHGLVRTARGLGSGLRDLVRYPSAVLGLLLILGLFAMTAYAILAIPLEDAIGLGRGARDDWYMTPKYAQPAWVNLFRRDDLPVTIVIDSAEAPVAKRVEVLSEDMTRFTLSFPFDFSYAHLPQDILVLMRSNSGQKRPHAIFTWFTPDGREMEIANFALGGSAQTYYLSNDKRFERKVRGQKPLNALFLAPGAEDAGPVQGRYEFRLEGLVFEEDPEFDAVLVVKGQAHGLAGTDHQGRDLLVPLLWGTPVALAFGFVGAVGTAMLGLVIAALGTWFGGWVDGLVQRLTEINMILPSLPIAIMVYLAYSKSVWVILGVMVILNIFGSAIKNYRAIFLQVKESPYVEAAQVYGASDARIVLRYLVPKMLPVLVPHLVTLIPSYVFLEATLAYLGVMDPILPTWGKVIYEALRNGAFRGYYYWVLEPIGLLLLTGLAFALLGFALDRILNPRLRSM